MGLDEKTTQEKKKTYWLCQCSCGRTKSIRGDNLKKIKTCGECYKDLTGQRFGKLVALKKGKKDKAGHQYWICQCDCGNLAEINSDNLRRGLTQSCGCLHAEVMHKTVFKDITGQKFGKLTALEYFTNEEGKTFWKCKCDCGNITIVQRNNLVNGHTQSCGCIAYSIGETNIANILNKNNIKFIKEYVFSDLPNRRYDFYLPELNRLIEFDGEQHFNFKKNWNNSMEDFFKSQKRDEEKNQYALNHHIPLIRIPYYERDKITLDLILGEQYLIKEEAQEVENDNI